MRKETRVPILSEQACTYPENLLESPPLDLPDRRWWVLYTKARQEKALSRDLFGYRIPFYLPQVKKTTLRRGRKMSSYIPLFSGYVFLFASEVERVKSLTTNRISRVLSVDDGEKLCYDLRQLQRLIASNAPVTVESRLSAGARVRVKQGPLMGLEGTVLTRRGETRLLIAVDFLQQGASVEIEDFSLERLD